MKSKHGQHEWNQLVNYFFWAGSLWRMVVTKTKKAWERLEKWKEDNLEEEPKYGERNGKSRRKIMKSR